jgi:hypothetical protein
MPKEYSMKSIEDLVFKVSTELEDLKKLNTETLPILRAIAIRERLLKELKVMLEKGKDGNGNNNGDSNAQSG